MNTLILSIDPGREKYGLALLDLNGRVLIQTILPLEKLTVSIADHVKRCSHLKMVIGNSTGRESVIRIARQLGIEYEVIDERHSSEEARRLYFQAHPPRGLKKILPRGFLIPSVAYDDWSAVIIGRRYLANLVSDGDSHG